MNYTCPKCGNKMHCIALASIPPIVYYKCFSCGYKSKELQEMSWDEPLPEVLRSENDY